jgi:hypothetical protein
MATNAQIEMLRALDPGVVIPGIDTPTGDPLATSQLESWTTLTTNSNAPVFYSATDHAVVVEGNNVVLSGYNFSGTDVMVWGNNCTIENSTFNDQGSGFNVVTQEDTGSGMTVAGCTFNGGDNVPVSFVASVAGYATITDNSFIDTPAHTITLSNGVVSGNYISGGGYMTGDHADAINVYDTTGPVLITDNYVDWTVTDNPGTLNNAVRITTDSGNTGNVTVTGNILLGGQWTVDADPSTINWLNPGATGTLGATGTMSNINISNNDIGFGAYGSNYQAGPGATQTDNTIFDYSNPIWATEGWNIYSGRGLGTTNVIAATSVGERIIAPATGTTTLYNGGLADVYMNGSTSETVFVDGQYMYGGAGANIFKYLTVGDSYANHCVDAITNFDPVKDVIDLSSMGAYSGLYNASPEANFTFIGTAPFSGAGGQVRYQYDAALNETLVEADVVGDSSADLEIRLMGDINLTAANFALTAAQSAADLADGAALNVSTARYGEGAEYSYTNVQGESYSSFQALYTSGATDVADNLNLSASANQLDLYAGNLTISRGAGTESLTSGSIAFPLAYEPNETIEAGTVGSETFDFGANFGNETIEGFAAGANPDTIQFAASSFWRLAPGMSQAQDLAAVLSQASSGAGGTTITDSAGDSLTLAGVTPAMISANPAQFKFV